MDASPIYSFALGVSLVVGGCESGPPSAPRSPTGETSSPAEPDPGPTAVDDSRRPTPAVTNTPSVERVTIDACATQTCPEGDYCDLQSVQCVQAPCPPVARCLTGTHPCAATTCATNHRCESHDGKGVCVPLAGGSDGSPSNAL